MNTYEMECVLESGVRKSKTIKAQHRYEAYTIFIKQIPLYELESVKAVNCKQITN